MIAIKVTDRLLNHAKMKILSKTDEKKMHILLFEKQYLINLMITDERSCLYKYVQITKKKKKMAYRSITMQNLLSLEIRENI